MILIAPFLNQSYLKICGADDPKLDAFAPINFSDKTSSNLTYYFYNIENPGDYLGGEDAIVVEKGPYIVK